MPLFRRAQKGTPGAPGKPGDIGPMGPAGKDGQDGRDGVDGRDGRDGKDGKQGKNGERGKRGPRGERGDRGPSGRAIIGFGGGGSSSTTGTPGPTGPQGPAGPSNVIRESSGPTDLTVGAIADGAILKRSGGTVVGLDLSNGLLAGIEGIIDGGGAVIPVNTHIYIEVPFNCTILAATMVSDVSGSAVVDIWKCTYAQFDSGSTHPVSGDKITGLTPPTISSAKKYQDTTLAGGSPSTSWNKTINAGDILCFNVNSCATIQKLTLSLKVQKS